MEELVQSAYFSSGPMKKTAHYHDCHQIILISRGEAEICVNEAKYHARSGSVIIFSRYENHSIHVLSKEYERYILRISPFYRGGKHLLFSLLANRPNGFSHVLELCEESESFRHLFSRIVREFNAQKALREDMLELLVRELLILLYRKIPTSMYDVDENMLNTVYDLQRRFESNYAQSYTLQALAKEYHVSPSSLSHRFKRIAGVSVMQYLLSCRIAAAKNDLSKTNLSIGEIVEHCGFSDNSNFSRTFKKLNGISPTEFREKYKQ